MLTVFQAGRRIIQLSGGWLYPLFALYLSAHRGAGGVGTPSATRRRRAHFAADTPITCEDTKIGQGAVFLYAGLGITVAHGALASRLAAQRAAALGIDLSADAWTYSLECRTESLLQDVADAGRALEILEGRLRAAFIDHPGQYVGIMTLDRSSAAARAVEEFLGG
jgi:hypothetical protein